MNLQTDSVLVEKVEDDNGQSMVAPVSVDQKESREEAETGQREVRCHDGLHAFLATQSNANIRTLQIIRVGTVHDFEGDIVIRTGEGVTLTKFN